MKAARLFVLAFVVCCSALAQNPTGTVVGIVTDASGSAIPNATVTVRNAATGLERQARTDGLGEFRAPLLPAGDYEVAATLAGFKTAVRSGLRVDVQATVRLDITMQVGEVRELVRVSSQAPLLETETSAVGQVIDSKQIQDLPLSVRQFMQLAFLVPFTTPATRDYRTTETPRGTSVPAGGGARPEENNYQIDGIDNKEAGRNSFGVTPPMDSIAEFRVQTGMAPAEFGRGGGTVINLVTRGGANTFHGSVYEFLRNNDLDARPFFSTGVSPLKRNQYGGALGGPILRNKLLFFGNYEGFRQASTGNPTVGQVPTQDQRNGIFTTTIVDPYTKQPFPNNRIPASLLDPTSVQILNLWPLPNNPGPAARNFINSSIPSAQDNRNYAVGRVDYNMGERNTLYGRYLYDKENTGTPETLLNNIGASNKIVTAQTAGGHYLRMFSPSLINDLSYGFMHYRNTLQTAYSYTKDYFSQLGITNVLASSNPLFWGTPGIIIPGYLATDSGNPNYRYSTVHEVQDGLVWNRGKHSIKFGGDFRLVDDTMLYTGGNGGWTFSNSYSGDNFADFLLGHPSQVSKTSLRPVGYNRVKYFGVYVQDDYKLAKNLTLNLGLRYEIESVPQDPSNAATGFDPTTGEALYSKNTPQTAAIQSFYANVRPDIKYRFVNTNTPVDADTNNVAPRIGLSWQPISNTTIRAGYGIFYGSPQTSSYSASGSNDFPPNTLRPIWTGTTGTPSLTGYNPDAGVSPQQALATAQLTLFPFIAGRVSGNKVLYDTGRNFPYPTIQQLTMSVQRQLSPSVLVEASFLGTRSQHLIGNDNLQITSPGTSAVAPRLPYSGWARIENTAAWHRAWYDGGALKLQQRLSHGLSYLVSYTYSKSLDDASQLNVDPLWTDPQNRLGSGRGPSDFDVRHRFVASYQYELPFGRGRQFGGSWHGATEAVLGGWGVRGITTFQTGFEYSPTMTLARVGDCLAACSARPARLKNGNLDSGIRTIDAYWDITAFVDPPLGTLGSTAGRNILYGPSSANTDLGVYKAFRIGESRSLEFRYEAFNAFNHTQFNAPATNFDAPATFGRITGTAAPRISQLALRFLF